MSVELNIFIQTTDKKEILLKSCLGGSAMYSVINEGVGSYDTPQKLTDGMITSAMVECERQKARLLAAIRSTSALDEILDCTEDIEQLESCSQELSFLREIADCLSINTDVEGLFFSYE